MNKYFATFLAGMLSLLPLQAQPARWLPWKKLPATRSTVSRATQNSVSNQLKRRVATTFQQVRQMQEQNPKAYKTLPFGEPIKTITQFDELNPKELYPQQTFLTNSEQAALYLAARNNRLILQEMHRVETLNQILNQALPNLKQIAQEIQQPTQWTLWLIQQIPTKTQYLFIGEEHNHPEIHSAIIQLMQGLRAAHPQRSIILFTEFLPEKLQWCSYTNIQSLPPNYAKFVPIWNEAVAQNITVIGLEPDCAMQDKCTVRTSYPSSLFSQRMSVWSTLEGVRLRNERWLATLDQYREQFPNALFVIYSGLDHCMYNRPFALANHYEVAHTFVVALLPNLKTSYKKCGLFARTKTIEPYLDPLECLIGHADFPQQALLWKDPTLARLTGFNARIKIPMELPNSN